MDERLKEIARAADGKQAADIIVLDVSEISSIADYFVFCSGINVRQTKTIAEAIEERLAAGRTRPLHIEGETAGSWVLMDYGDIIVHIFMPEAREFYDLEGLWGDAAAVPVEELLGEAV